MQLLRISGAQTLVNLADQAAEKGTAHQKTDGGSEDGLPELVPKIEAEAEIHGAAEDGDRQPKETKQNYKNVGHQEKIEPGK